MWNQHHCLVLLQTENPHQLPSKTKAPWKGVISQPKGVKTQPKGVIFSVVILMFLKTTSFRQPASQMGVQLFGGWFFDYYVSFFLYVLIQFIIIYVNPQSKNCSWAAGFQENITKKWKGFFCLNRLFFLRRQFFLAVQEPPIFLLPVDLGIYIYIHAYICMYIIIYLQYICYIQNVQTFSEHWRNKTTEFHLDFRGDEAQFGLISFVRCHRDRVLCFLSHTLPGRIRRHF